MDQSDCEMAGTQPNWTSTTPRKVLRAAIAEGRAEGMSRQGNGERQVGKNSGPSNFSLPVAKQTVERHCERTGSKQGESLLACTLLTITLLRWPRMFVQRYRLLAIDPAYAGRGCWSKEVGWWRVIGPSLTFGYQHPEAYRSSSRALHTRPLARWGNQPCFGACRVHVLPNLTCLPSVRFSSRVCARKPAVDTVELLHHLARLRRGSFPLSPTELAKKTGRFSWKSR